MRYRWVMLGLLWLLYFSFGLITRSSSPLVTPIIRDLGMSYGQMGFVLGSWQMTYIVLAVMAGIIMDRWGIKRSLFAGALIISLSAILRSFSTGFVTLLLFVALFGAGGPMISIGCPKTIALWFKGKDRGTAVGIYSTGPWIGGTISLAATNGVVMPLVDYSWRMTFASYGAMALVIAMFWWFFARDADTDTQSERFNPVQVLTDLMKIPNVRIILVCGLLSFGIGHGFSAWLPKILESKGYSPTLAGIGAAAPIIASIPAVLIIPRLVPAHLRGKIIALLAVLGTASILWVVATSLIPVVGLLMFGATSTCVMPLLTLTLMETPGVASKYLGSATGIFFCVAEIGGFFGPFIVGYLMDVTGGFLSGALLLGGLGIIIFGLMFFLTAAPPES
jgi:cyanate permease